MLLSLFPASRTILGYLAEVQRASSRDDLLYDPERIMMRMFSRTRLFSRGNSPPPWMDFRRYHDVRQSVVYKLGNLFFIISMKQVYCTSWKLV